MEEEFIESVASIHRNKREFDIKEFLPDFPTPRGNEPIFKIGWANAHRYLSEDCEYLIKGLHLIELEYRKLIKNDFGFGSPSPTEKLIRALEKKSAQKAKELRQWVARNGGNYYIKAGHLSRLEKNDINYCPIPMVWNSIHTELTSYWREVLNAKGDKPPVPLILAAWHMTSIDQKSERWRNTIEWAQASGCPQLIKELEEDEKNFG